MSRFAGKPDDLETAEKLSLIADIMRILPFDFNLWRIQNLFYEMKVRIYPEFREKALRGDEDASLWIRYFISLGKILRIYIE